MSTNTETDSIPGTCICKFNYYFWMSLSISIVSLLVFPIIQFVYGIDLRNTDTSIDHIIVTCADWLLVDGLLSTMTGIMTIYILKNSTTVPNIIKIIFNTCIFFLISWNILGTIMIFSKTPLVIQGLAVIYNYILLTAYVSYFIVTIKYKNYVEIPEKNMNPTYNINPHITHNMPYHDDKGEEQA